MSEELRENKMGTMPVRRLVLSMSLPMMIAMLVQALYNVVDSYFVAKLSENALTAVGMVFPFQNLMIAVGVGTGVGVNAFLSRSLGEKNYDAANRAAENGVFLAVLSTLVFTVAGLTLAHPFIAVQTDIPDIVSSGTAICASAAACPLGCSWKLCSNGCSRPPGAPSTPCSPRAPGPSSTSSWTRCSSSAWAPSPAWRWRGCRSHRPGPDRGGRPGGAVQPHLQPRYPPNPPGLPPQRPGDPKHLLRGRAVHHSQLHRLGDAFGMNQILFAFSSTAVAVFNVYFKLQSFVFMPVFGSTTAWCPSSPTTTAPVSVNAWWIR